MEDKFEGLNLRDTARKSHIILRKWLFSWPFFRSRREIVLEMCIPDGKSRESAFHAINLILQARQTSVYNRAKSRIKLLEQRIEYLESLSYVSSFLYKPYHRPIIICEGCWLYTVTEIVPESRASY